MHWFNGQVLSFQTGYLKNSRMFASSAWEIHAHIKSPSTVRSCVLAWFIFFQSMLVFKFIAILMAYVSEMEIGSWKMTTLWMNCQSIIDTMPLSMYSILKTESDIFVIYSMHKQYLYTLRSDNNSKTRIYTSIDALDNSAHFIIRFCTTSTLQSTHKVSSN